MFKRLFRKILFFISPDIFLFQKKAELHNTINRINRGLINHRIVKCNICDWEGNRFDAIGTGSYIRYNAACPLCGSLERHRMIARFFDEKGIVKKNGYFLDVAPFKGLGYYLIGKYGVRYFSIDISLDLCQIKMDLQAIAFHDNSFDTILCSHVLEHIPDDILAMRELRRILKQDGICIILLPFNQDLPATRWFGFPNPKLCNHVREYGSDVLERIKISGFNVEPFFYRAYKSDCTEYGLGEIGEHILFCRK